MSHTIKDLVTAYGNKVIDNRRYLHAHPELSFQETDTAHWIRERLAAAGIPILEGISGNSTVGYLIGSQPGPSIGLRADIDALGLTEESDFSFKSTKPGVMHACGHDAHTAVLMGVAEILAAHKDLIKGTVYFIFQQGEEFLPGGACTLVEEGIADKVDAFFAIHVDAERPFGSVDVLEGTRSAAIATFEITVTGKGGHGSTPHTANNPLLPASDLVDAISMIPAMKCGPLDNATVSVTQRHSRCRQRHSRNSGLRRCRTRIGHAVAQLCNSGNKTLGRNDSCSLRMQLGGNDSQRLSGSCKCTGLRCRHAGVGS